MTKINIEREEFIRVGTTLYKLVNQPRLNGGYVTHPVECRDAPSGLRQGIHGKCSEV